MSFLKHRKVICTRIENTNEGIEITFVDNATKGEDTKVMIRVPQEAHGYIVGREYSFEVK